MHRCCMHCNALMFFVMLGFYLHSVQYGSFSYHWTQSFFGFVRRPRITASLVIVTVKRMLWWWMVRQAAQCLVNKDTHPGDVRAHWAVKGGVRFKCCGGCEERSRGNSACRHGEKMTTDETSTLWLTSRVSSLPPPGDTPCPRRDCHGRPRKRTRCCGVLAEAAWGRPRPQSAQGVVT